MRYFAQPYTSAKQLIGILLFLLGSFAACNTYAQTEIVVTRGDGNWPPFEMIQDGKLTGFHIDLIRAVAEEANIHVVFKTYPWLRAVQMAKTGRSDAVSYLAKNEERQEFIVFSDNNVLSGTDHYLIKCKDRTDISFDGDYKSIESFSLVHIDGYTFGDDFDKVLFVQKAGVKNAEEVVELVAKGRYDIGIVSPADLGGAEASELIDKIEFLEPVLYSTTVYIGFSKAGENRHAYAAFTQAMKEFKKSNRYQQLRFKYGL